MWRFLQYCQKRKWFESWRNSVRSTYSRIGCMFSSAMDFAASGANFLKAFWSRLRSYCRGLRLVCLEINNCINDINISIIGFYSTERIRIRIWNRLLQKFNVIFIPRISVKQSKQIIQKSQMISDQNVSKRRSWRCEHKNRDGRASHHRQQTDRRTNRPADRRPAYHTNSCIF